MSFNHRRWAPVATVAGIVAVGLLLMALYRPLPLGIGVFIVGSTLLYPAARSARRSRIASAAPAAK